MQFVTDRTEADVLLGKPKGKYSHSDLNRVEQAVALLCEMAATLGVQLDVTTKIDWGRPDVFSVETWPTQSQMTRYLQNVHTVCNAFGVDLPLPKDLNHLDWNGANQIEKALQQAYSVAQDMLNA